MEKPAFCIDVTMWRLPLNGANLQFRHVVEVLKKY